MQVQLGLLVRLENRDDLHSFGFDILEGSFFDPKPKCRVAYLFRPSLPFHFVVSDEVWRHPVPAVSDQHHADREPGAHVVSAGDVHAGAGSCAGPLSIADYRSEVV